MFKSYLIIKQKILTSLKKIYRFPSKGKDLYKKWYGYIEDSKIISRYGFFDNNYYATSNPDLKVNKRRMKMHFIRIGWKNGLSPNSDFNISEYLKVFGDVPLGINPYIHFLKTSSHEEYSKEKYKYNLLKESHYFNVQYYLSVYNDVKDASIDPIYHYLKYGWKEGRNPSMEFSTSFYLDQNPDVAKNEINPLYHFLVDGIKKNKKIKSDFIIDNLSHDEKIKIIQKSKYFDLKYYIAMNDDIDLENIDPVHHYLYQGWKEFRNPSNNFKTYYYLQKYQVDKYKDINPLLLYELYGVHNDHIIPKNIMIKPKKVICKQDIKQLELREDLTFSIIMPTYNRKDSITKAIDSVLSQSFNKFELLICDDGSTDNTENMIVELYENAISNGQIRYFKLKHSGVSNARNYGLSKANGCYIAYLDSDNTWDKDYLMYNALCYLKSPKSENAYSGLEVFDIHSDRHFYLNEDFSYHELSNKNFIDLNIYTHSKKIGVSIGGFDESLKRFVDWDMILKHCACFTPIRIDEILAQYFLDKKNHSITHNVSYSENRKIIQDKMNTQKIISIKIPCEDLTTADNWGDYHLAKSLQEKLIDLGFLVRLDVRNDWYNSNLKSDVSIIMRGIVDYVPSSGFNIMWIISHPEAITYSELIKYNLILTASEDYLEKFIDTNLPPIRLFNQFTDPDIFYHAFSKKHQCDVLFVGNSRKILRKSVKACVDNGVNISVYGNGWEGLIPNEYIKGSHILNADLKKYYSSAKIVLNDHWDDMSKHGFVSNRIYDVYACGGFLLTDKNIGYSKVLEEKLHVFEDDMDLIHKIRYFLSDSKKRNKHAKKIQKEVLRNHTVTQRAKELSLLLVQIYEYIDDIKSNLNIAQSINTHSIMEEQKSYEKRQYRNQKNINSELIAWYLPQYYSFKENDQFWGKGFTDWFNVAKALPIFKDHYQPKIPTELGFYDNENPKTIEKQVKMAKNFGIKAFCFHYYNFDGRTIMDLPLEHLYKNKDLDFRYLIHWANEPWSRTWDGSNNKNEILLDQKHSEKNNNDFIYSIIKYLKDDRYYCIDGKKMIIIYKPNLFPDAKKTIRNWRIILKKNGLSNIHFSCVHTSTSGEFDPSIYGFDSAVEFPPHCVPRLNDQKSIDVLKNNFNGLFCNYLKIIEKSIFKQDKNYLLFRGIMPGFDNTSRKNNPLIYYNSNPYLFKIWLKYLIRISSQKSGKNPIFINAWNEWAEGAYLEPDRKYGFAFLNAISDLNSNKKYTQL